jgi:23S rRNA (adenine-N6)-dimethyltransferase
MAERLRQKVHDIENVDVLQQDIVTMPHPDEPFILVGNVPFSITSAIVDWALASPRLDSATLITQHEYARKRTGDYGRWSLVTVRTWPWWEWSLGTRIRRSSFDPQPSVDAAVLMLVRRNQPLVPQRDVRAWTRAVETGFKGVGGSLCASLSTIYPPSRVKVALARAGISRDEVVAFVSPDQWMTIFRALSSKDR